MDAWTDTTMMFIVLTNFMLLSSGRLSACIRAVALQGIAIGVLLALSHADEFTYRIVLLITAVVGVKGVAFPVMLRRTLRNINVRREVEPYVGYPLSIFAGVLGLMLSIWLGSRLQLPAPVASSLAMPVAFSTMLTGFFLIISRKKALTQVIGYLAAENGIFVFGVSAVHVDSIWVELGILLDFLVAVLVMGIAVHHINKEFESIDVDRFSSLKG